MHLLTVSGAALNKDQFSHMGHFSCIFQSWKGFLNKPPNPLPVGDHQTEGCVADEEEEEEDSEAPGEAMVRLLDNSDYNSMMKYMNSMIRDRLVTNLVLT